MDLTKILVPRSNQDSWKEKWINNQFIDEEKFYASNPNTIVEKNYNIKKQRRDQYKLATGYGLAALSTKLFFTYLGGLIQARKQFIPGIFYFRNHYYNWVSGLKFIIPGFLIGTIVSTFTFGHPFLLEDYIRNKFRHMTQASNMDGGILFK